MTGMPPRGLHSFAVASRDIRRRHAYSMLRKSMPSGHDPMGGYRFSETIMLKQHARLSAMTIHPEFIAL